LALSRWERTDLRIQLEKPLIDTLPDPARIRVRLGHALREVQLLRRLLSLAKTAETYRAMDRDVRPPESTIEAPSA
jgi:hypothetical protein